MSDQNLVQAWQPFFTALAGAAATLAGLVFIAVSLHPQTTLAHPLMRVRAFVAAMGFLLGLAWALIMLLPANTAPMGSLLLLAVGIGGGTLVVYKQIMVRTQGLSAVRVTLGDPLLLAPVVAGVAALLQPESPVPYVFIAVATSLGFFFLFAQSWTLVLHGILGSDGPYRSEPRSGTPAILPSEADDTVANRSGSGSAQSITPSSVSRMS